MEEFEHLDFYSLLGINRTASTDEIKRAYRQQISRYHPDRFVNADAAAKAYASERAQRINEAYRVLGDFNARSAYNRQLSVSPARAEMPAATTTRVTRSRADTPPASDLAAALYAQAQTEIAAGNDAAAAATLRQLQRLNPFYRDSSNLLEQVEARLGSEPAATPPVETTSGVSRRVLIAGGLGSALLAGLAAFGLSRRETAATVEPTAAATPVSGIVVPLASTTVEPSASLVPAPSTTTAPAASAITAPSALPTASATAVPSATPEPTATLVPAEQGSVVLADNFSPGSGWAEVSNTGWSVGYRDGAYQIAADEGVGNIWSYRTSPVGADFTVGVDVEVSGGVAGLLLRYIDGDSYLAFVIDPPTQRVYLDEKSGGRLRSVIDSSSSTMRTAPDAINRLVARLSGATVELFVNDQSSGAIDLPFFAEADRYGLLAAGRGNRAVALFRNLQIRQE
jgi:hypothetical protein